MNDNSPNNADHYRALADDAYAASDRLSGDSQRIMRQIAVSYHRLAILADQEERPSLAAPSLVGAVARMPCHLRGLAA
jgi:hypothetical protein